MAFDIGFLVFPRVQQLDLTAPYEVLAARQRGAAIARITGGKAGTRRAEEQ